MKTNPWRAAGWIAVATVVLSLCGWAICRQWQAADWGKDERILRIGYNLTDDRVRRALQHAAEVYEQAHPDVRVVLQAVPPAMYQRWLVTQAAGETIPDLVHVPGVANQWGDFAHKYLVPLSDWIARPNPYDDGDRAWQDGFLDHLESGFFIHMMEYYRVPLAINSTRLIVNLDLLKEITGSDRPPATLTQLLAIGERVKRTSVLRELPVVNLAVPADDIIGQAEGSFLFRCVNQAATAGLATPYDFALLGAINPVHNYYGLTSGTFTYDQPRIRATFELMRKLVGQMQPGWANYAREDTRMHFLSRQAVFTIGSTWDFQTLKSLADFRMATLPFPQIEAVDRKGRRVMLPNAREDRDPGLALGVTRSSRHQNLAIDFIHFCTSPAQNTALCRELGWFPAVETEDLPPEIAEFRPIREGAIEFWSYVGGFGSVRTYFIQQFPVFLNGGIDFDDFIGGLTQTWRQHGWTEMRKLDEVYLRGMAVTERNVALEKARMLFPQARDGSETALVRARSNYTLGLEIMERITVQITNRVVVERKLRTAESSYHYPPFARSAADDGLTLITEPMPPHRASSRF